MLRAAQRARMSRQVGGRRQQRHRGSSQGSLQRRLHAHVVHHPLLVAVSRPERAAPPAAPSQAWLEGGLQRHRQQVVHACTGG